MTLLVQGTPEFNMPDNIAYQSSRGNWIVHEDGSTGASFANRNNDLGAASTTAETATQCPTAAFGSAR